MMMLCVVYSGSVLFVGGGSSEGGFIACEMGVRCFGWLIVVGWGYFDNCDCVIVVVIAIVYQLIKSSCYDY